jgi:hypothetical protein
MKTMAAKLLRRGWCGVGHVGRARRRGQQGFDDRPQVVGDGVLYEWVGQRPDGGPSPRAGKGVLPVKIGWWASPI